MEDALYNLRVWTRSRQLAVKIYQHFGNCKDFGFRDQITRAAVSVPSNIAEGYERHSKREFSRFLKISRGSCAELRTQIYIAHDIGIIDETTVRILSQEALEISKMLQGLINRNKLLEN